MKDNIPVIDLFAGPGGLGEGFASFKISKTYHPFTINLSIEKDFHANRTLELRSFYRQFQKGEIPLEYYEYLWGRISRDELFKRHPREGKRAQQEAWRATLGETDEDEVEDRIHEAIGYLDRWVLIGGPPCQAYSFAGRSRIRGEDKKKKTNNYENDERHHLYREYLRILAAFEPPVFVMENVKGILSAEVKGEKIFDRIFSDLKFPVNAIERIKGPKFPKRYDVGYRIFSLVQPAREASFMKGSDFVIRSEQYGIPQARHRVFLLGIRSDLDLIPRCLGQKEKRSVCDAIFDLPTIRSSLSKEPDSLISWHEKIRSVPKELWFKDIEKDIQKEMVKCLQKMGNLPTGGEFMRANYCKKRIKIENKWFFDAALKGYANHISRAHISEDLKRYFFAACFARVRGRSPLIQDFPRALYPDHRNLHSWTGGELIFDDRFHVQLLDAPSTTIMSHMAKDGHYFIHPDPLQCRSLTVREAARLQTFPDNYFFEGSRTAQYKQVGNAVPVLLAKQIAEVVYNLFENTFEMPQFSCF